MWEFLFSMSVTLSEIVRLLCPEKHGNRMFNTFFLYNGLAKGTPSKKLYNWVSVNTAKFRSFTRVWILNTELSPMVWFGEAFVFHGSVWYDCQCRYWQLSSHCWSFLYDFLLYIMFLATLRSYFTYICTSICIPFVRCFVLDSSLELAMLDSLALLFYQLINLLLLMDLTCESEQLEGTENSIYLDVLRLFAHGTWSDFKSKPKDWLCVFSFL